MSINHNIRDEALHDKIERLIECEQDTNERARMLIILQLFHFLSDNMKSVFDIAEELKAHRIQFEEHVNSQNKILDRGWGLWKVVSVVAVVLQLFVGSALGWFWDDHKKTEAALASVKSSIISLEKNVALNSQILYSPTVEKKNRQ